MSKGEPDARTSQPAPATQAIVPVRVRVSAKDLNPGDIVWVAMTENHVMGAEQQKRRPWLIITTPRFVKYDQYAKAGQGLAHGVPLSKSVVGKLHPDGRPLREFWVSIPWDDIQPDSTSLDPVPRLALCSQVRTLSELRFQELAGRIKPSSRVKITEVRAGVSFVLGY